MAYTFNHPPSRRPSGWQGHAEKQEQDTEYPQRAGEPDCSYYVKFGRCRYGMSCMFNHPIKKSGWPGRQAWASEKQELRSEYPRRPGEPDCSYYIKFGSCKFGMDCKFNHPLHEPMAHGRECVSNGAFSLEQYEQIFPGIGCKCSHQGGGRTEFEKVKLNFLGLPLRQGTGVCSYYVRTGICKFGTNCKFHHPEPGSEHENGEASRHAVQGSSEQNFYSVLLREELNEQPATFSASSPSLIRQQGIILPHGTYPPYPESSEYQFGGSRCETVKRVRYTRDQLLGLREALQIVDVPKDILELKHGIDVQLRDSDGNWVPTDSNVQTRAYNRYDLKDNREWRLRSSQTPNIVNDEKSLDNIHEAKESHASNGKQEQIDKHGQLSIQFDSKTQEMMDWGKLCIAPLNFRSPNTMSGEMKMMDSSSRAPESNLAGSTTIRSNQGSSDENYIGTVDKDVHKRSEEVILRESSNEEPNSVKPQKNYVNEESSHVVDSGENVSRSNSSASMSINRVGCSISEIMGLVVDAGAQEGSDEHFIATQLFIRPEYREMFLTHTPQGRLGWLRRMCQLKK